VDDKPDRERRPGLRVHRDPFRRAWVADDLLRGSMGRKIVGPPAFPALAFSPVTGVGHFVQIDEVTGVIASSHTSGNFGVNVSGNFYQIWVNLPDTSTSIEFQVELNPSGLGVIDGFPSAGQQTSSAAVFTVCDVSIGAHP